MVILTATHVDDNAKVDVAFPAKCEALFARVEVGPADKVLDEARAVATAVNATPEERGCAASVVSAIGTAGGTSTANLRALPEPCQKPVDEAGGGHIETARRQLESLLRTVDGPAVRACAEGILARLPKRPTFSNWAFEQANRVTRDVTGWVPGGPFVLADGSKTTVVAIVVFLTIGMLLLALRQIARWRRERTPGPVEIATVSGATEDENGPVLAGVMRQRLAQAGVYPNPTVSGVGELAVDVTDVFGAAGRAGWFGTLVTALKTALAVKVGYSLKASIDHGSGDPPVRLLVQLDQLGSGQTVSIASYYGATEREAATNAAFGTYLWLNALPEVRRRTPSYLQWISPEGVRLYEDASEDVREGSFLTARQKLIAAARHEPANLLVQLQLCHTNIGLARGTTTDNALRPPCDVGAFYLAALVAALRAVQLNPHSTEAQSRMALVLSYPRSWQDNCGPGSEEAEEVRELLRGIEGDDFELPASDDDRFPRVVLALAHKRWRMARRRTWWPWIVWVGCRLNRRRTVSGQFWPLRRGRHAIHDHVLADEVSTRYDLMVATRPGRRSLLGKRIVTLARLWQIRFGRMLWLRRPPSEEVTVQYNLAAAYARRAIWLAGADPRRAKRAQRYALQCLERSFTGVGRQLTESDLDEIWVDPDFAELRETEEFARWSTRFASFDELAAARLAWHEVFEAIAERAGATGRGWIERLGTVAPPRQWDAAAAAWASSAASMLGDEVERWRALGAWTENPAATRARAIFVALTADATINRGRPVGGARGMALPGDEAASVATMASANLAACQRIGNHAQAMMATAQSSLETALDELANCNIAGVETVFREAGVVFRSAWERLADFLPQP